MTICIHKHTICSSIQKYTMHTKEGFVMKSENHRGHHGGRHHEETEVKRGRRGVREGEGRRRSAEAGVRREGAKTFRRARALSFLERLEGKRDTLKKQLETVELQTLHPSIVGELKAVEEMIAEFVNVFELHEVSIADEDENYNNHKANESHE